MTIEFDPFPHDPDADPKKAPHEVLGVDELAEQKEIDAHVKQLTGRYRRGNPEANGERFQNVLEARAQMLKREESAPREKPERERPEQGWTPEGEQRRYGTGRAEDQGGSTATESPYGHYVFEPDPNAYELFRRLGIDSGIDKSELKDAANDQAHRKISELSVQRDEAQDPREKEALSTQINRLQVAAHIFSDPVSSRDYIQQRKARNHAYSKGGEKVVALGEVNPPAHDVFSDDYFKRLGVRRHDDQDEIATHYYLLMRPFVEQFGDKDNQILPLDSLSLENMTDTQIRAVQNLDQAIYTLGDDQRKLPYATELGIRETRGLEGPHATTQTKSALRRGFEIGALVGVPIAIGAGIALHHHMQSESPPPGFVTFPPNTRPATQMQKLLELLDPACTRYDITMTNNHFNLSGYITLAREDVGKYQDYKHAAAQMRLLASKLRGTDNADAKMLMDAWLNDTTLQDKIKAVTPQKPPTTPAHFADIADQAAHALDEMQKTKERGSGR